MKQRILCMLISIAILFTYVDISVFAVEVKETEDTISGNDVEKEDGIEEISDASLSINSTVSDNSVSDLEDIILDNNTKVQTTSLETSGQCGDNLTWRIENEILTISGTGAMWNYEDSKEGQTLAPWSAFEEQLTTLVLEEGITYIGERAFEGCSCFEGKLVIPNTVTSIGNSAFQSCLGIEELVLSNNLKTIGNHAFVGCFRLKGRLEIPNGVEEIGYHAFANCTGFNGDLIIPSSVKVVGSHAFYYCSGIDGIVKIESKDILLSDRVFYGTAIDTIYGFKGTDAEEYAIAHDLQFYELDTGEVLVGSGTENDPYIISSVDELSYFMRKVNAGETFAGKCFVLDRNVYLNDISNYSQWSDEYTPALVWDGINGFAGNFDGQDYTIYGLYMKKETDNVGFFNEFNKQSEVVIKNINFENVYVSGGNNVGAVVGKADCVRIENCSVNGAVKGTGDNIGGLVGYSGSAGHYGTKIYDSINNASVNGSNYVGGFVGQAYIGNNLGLGNENVGGSEKLILQRCTNKGNVNGAGNYIGGIAGSLDRMMNCGGMEITELTNIGKVVGQDNVGGIAGLIKTYSARSEQETHINYISNQGNVVGGTYVGGIAGKALWNGGGAKVINNSYNAGDVTANNSDAGGIYGNANGGNDINLSFNVGKITTPVSAGALIGYSTGASMNNVYYLTVSAASSKNGDAKETNVKELSENEMKQKESFEGFDFENVWAFSKNNNKYPMLRWEVGENIEEETETLPNYEGFNYDIYRAESLVNNKENFEYIRKVINENSMCEMIEEEIGWIEASVIEFVRGGMGFGWVEDPAGLATYKITAQDLYFTVIMDLLKDTSKKNLGTTYAESAKWVDKWYKKLKEGTDIVLKGRNYSELSSSEKKKLEAQLGAIISNDMELIKIGKYKVGDIVKNVGVAMKAADTWGEILMHLQNIFALYTLSADTKEAVETLYEQTIKMNSEDVYFLGALKWAMDCMENDPVTQSSKVIVGYGADAVWDEFWKGLSKKAKHKCPALEVAMITGNTGRFFYNALANTEEVAAQKIMCVVVADVLRAVDYTCLHTMNQYVNNRTEENARLMIEMVKMMFKVHILDREQAISFIEASRNNIFDAGIENAKKIIAIIWPDTKEKDFIDELKEDKDAINRIGQSVLSSWVLQLQTTHPNSGLYERFSNEYKKAQDKIREHVYTFACPVDVTVVGKEGTSFVRGNIVHCEDDVAIVLEGDKKTIYLNSDEDYEISLQGTDVGNMNVTVYSYDNKDNLIVDKVYREVPLTTGTSYKMNASNIKEGDKINVLLDDNKENEIVGAVPEEQKISIVQGSIKYQNKELQKEIVLKEGDVADIIAQVPQGHDFVEWSIVGDVEIEDKQSSCTQIIAKSGDAVITANCKKDYAVFKINASFTSGGYIPFAEHIIAKEGTEQAVYIIADNGFEIADVQVDGKSVGKVTKYVFDNIKQVHEIHAIFKKTGNAPTTLPDTNTGREENNMDEGKSFEENNSIFIQSDITKKQEKMDDTESLLPSKQSKYNNYAYLKKYEDIELIFELSSEGEDVKETITFPVLENNHTDIIESDEKPNEQKQSNEKLVYVILLVTACMMILGIIVYKNRKKKR